MAPSFAVTPVPTTISSIEKLKASAGSNTAAIETYPRAPLTLSGALDEYEHFDSTTVLGREYPTIQIRDLLNSPKADELLRELAIIIAQRNVVFFRKQDLTTDELKVFVQRLGELSGKPSGHGLHIHPVLNGERDSAITHTDNEISRISTELGKQIYSRDTGTSGADRRQSVAGYWHSDITFETAAPDFSSLHLTQVPESGGDTLWASGYELYDRISPPYQRFLETLTATYAQPAFNEAAKRNGFALYSKPRGSPLNIGEELTTVHPIIRTNPITGWKSVYAVGHHVAKINDLTESESTHLLKKFRKLITDNNDLQVRFKWGAGDLAIWDNRSTYHTATPDLKRDAKRWGDRAVGIAEVPYLDPESTGRREALGEQVPAKRDL